MLMILRQLSLNTRKFQSNKKENEFVKMLEKFILLRRKNTFWGDYTFFFSLERLLLLFAIKDFSPYFSFSHLKTYNFIKIATFNISWQILYNFIKKHYFSTLFSKKRTYHFYFFTALFDLQKNIAFDNHKKLIALLSKT